VSNDWKDKYPFNFDEGCNWVLEGQSPNIDFVCIHPYGDQWRRDDSMEQKLE
jgi:hypothetical protein